MRRACLLLLGGAALASGCAPAVARPPASPAPEAHVRRAMAGGIDDRLPAMLDSVMAVGISERAAPGGSIAVGRYGQHVLTTGFGRTDWATDAPAVDDRTIYDLASLTKVVVTTTAAMILEEELRLELDRTVASYLPEFNAPEKATITVRMLLTHRGGLEAYGPLFVESRGRMEYLAAINARPLRHPPGSRSIYSDWDMILLQLVIERITGQSLDVFARQRILEPLGMSDSFFNPDSTLFSRIAPTELQTSTGRLIHGVVHDENARAIGGVSGHAGFFSSARDLAIFAQMILNGGHYGSVRILRPTTVARWTSRQDADTSRALGWDTPSGRSSAGRFFSPRSFGHTGFTGTSIWIDPVKDLYVILLTNRVNPTRENTRVFQLRRDVADAVQWAVMDAPLVEWEVTRIW